MEQDGTPVIFRADRKRGPDFQITAVFPTEPADDTNGRHLTCYAHLGQHGACSRDWVWRCTRPATPAEYASLKRELEAAPYGYRLKVYKRMTRQHREQFNASLRRP